MAVESARTKQEALDRLCQMLNVPEMDLSPGSTIPAEVFYLAARQLGIPPEGSMPVLGQAIARVGGSRVGTRLRLAAYEVEGWVDCHARRYEPNDRGAPSGRGDNRTDASRFNWSWPGLRHGVWRRGGGRRRDFKELGRAGPRYTCSRGDSERSRRIR